MGIRTRSDYFPIHNCLASTQWRKKNEFFQIIITFYFQYKNYFNTKTTCNKCSFDYLHWLLNYGKLYRKDGVLLAVHTSGASPQISASHLLTFLVAQLQFLRKWKLSDCRLYEVFEHRLLIWGNPKEGHRPSLSRLLPISKTCVLFAPPCTWHWISTVLKNMKHVEYPPCNNVKYSPLWKVTYCILFPAHLCCLIP